MDTRSILSICISSYNRSEKVERLVKEILSCKSDKLSVVVVDDKSEDDTVQRLEKIADKRFSLFQNAENLGARRNWYETIDRGDGTYILQLLDRDWIKSQYIERIIEILENNKAGYGYIGNIYSYGMKESNNEVYQVFPHGKVSMEAWALVAIHPTGFLIKRNCWDSIQIKKRFFYTDSYGIYPHGYIYAMLAGRYNGILIRYKMLEMSAIQYKSKFYAKENRDYWWMPGAVYDELKNWTLFAYGSMKTGMKCKRNIIFCRYREQLNRATVIYHDIAKDYGNARHYGIDCVYVHRLELYRINFKFACAFIKLLLSKCRNMLDVRMFFKIIKYSLENINSIRMISDKEERVNRKMDIYNSLYSAWRYLKRNSVPLSRYLANNNIYTVAIYGYGGLGLNLYSELQQDGIYVKYFIDRDARYMIENIKIASLDDELQAVDAVIVTLIDQFEDIKKKVEAKINARVISAESVVYGSYTN